MRRLKRNQTNFQYCLVSSLEEQRDSQGFRTGRGSVQYEEPVDCKGCIVYKGTSSYKPYGIQEDWSLQIIPDNPIPVTVGTKIIVKGKDYYVLAHPTTMNEQKIYCK